MMKLYRVEQQLVSAPLSDIAAAVRQSLDALKMDVPRGDVAITAGSRGIANLALITKAVGDWFRDHGANPFLVPAMGSHNGATAEGQENMVESLGLTSDATGMDIRSSMDCVKVGRVASGDVWMDKIAHASAGVFLINRIKLHTSFSGPIQSGLAKMMVVGMGKIRSAETFHAAPPDERSRILAEMGQAIIDTGKMLGGLAILEDGYDQTAEVHAIAGREILSREPVLLERHRHYVPSLPCDRLNVLVVGEIGKNLSGTGMDTNVIGRRGIRGSHDPERPRINVIAALRLSAASQGNALGVGLADFITQPLRDAIDEQKTRINVLTTGDMQRMAIPATLRDDEECIRTIASRFGTSGWMFIPDTLHLETLYVTRDVATSLRAHPRCRIADEPTDLQFEDGHLRLF